MYLCIPMVYKSLTGTGNFHAFTILDTMLEEMFFLTLLQMYFDTEEEIFEGERIVSNRETQTNETRFVVHLNTFGYFANGTLDVHLVSLNLPKMNGGNKAPVGFSLARSRVTGILTYTAEEVEECMLQREKSEDELILFIIDTENHSVAVKHFGHSDFVLESRLKTGGGKVRRRRGESVGEHKEEKSEDEAGKQKETSPDQSKAPVSTASKPVESLNGKTLELEQHGDSYNFSFRLIMSSQSQGLYNLDFQNCNNMRQRKPSPYSLHVEITEKNPRGYLSASDIPLPRLYICMAAIFFTAAVVWTYTLLKYRYSVFKIHWLMAALAYTKAVSLLFHSINYHFINSEGHPIEGWAVMYYITHLLKGALLFITLALIGTGFAFVKYILSDKEKKIFMIVIPLQVLANVSYIIIEETEEGASEYALWREILFLVDLICCGAVLFPVVWSIRHLQEASNTDGKAAMNLEKLKLFRHYYVMIVCYIYFTRIIAILLKVTVPFQWQWCQEFLVEVSTLIFFVLTGFKFRPASNNPYLQLPQDEEDLEMDEVVTESGALEGIHKVKKTSNGRERQREVAL
ncbi:protein GPR108 isoform X2 [Pimephales promelas]|uniref:protein GPR108 isoform X2 n=1 Tax=Pimephales promelas TaxID=90988 RepID=UPI001955B46F|nr:protein GPR108 isoform X2 [Pimephales promelas]